MKKMYKDVDIIYWANCCGDINLPSDPKEKIILHSRNDLPNDIAPIYDACWFDDYPHMYPVTIEEEGKKQNGILISLLFDYEYIANQYGEDLKNGMKIDPNMAMDYFRYLCDVATMYKETDLAKRFHVDVFVGDGTDPDGHEVAIFIPKDIVLKERDMLLKISSDFEKYFDAADSRAVNIVLPSGYIFRTMSPVHSTEIVAGREYLFLYRSSHSAKEYDRKICRVIGKASQREHCDLLAVSFDNTDSIPIVQAVHPEELIEIKRKKEFNS